MVNNVSIIRSCRVDCAYFCMFLNMSQKRKLNHLTIADKVHVIQLVEKGNRKKQDIAKEFNIPPNTLSTFLKNKADILKKFEDNKGDNKRSKPAEYPNVEVCLFKWFTQCRDKNIPISGPILKEKAEYFATQFGYSNFKASQGWLGNWKNRHNIIFRKICGESASVNDSLCNEWLGKLSNIIKEYSPDDVFNVDETALFFKCLPDRTFILKGETCSGGKQSKERITILLGSNMSGSEKIKPLIIGKSKKPRCFKGVKSFPLDYESNKKAWMTGDLFKSWLVKFDQKMRLNQRNVLLFIDNCTAHCTINLKSVRIEFLPPNTTSKLQPMDQGIIQNFKTLYRKEIIRKIVYDIDEGRPCSINLLQSMRMCEKAWRNVQPNTIINCFKKAGFYFNEEQCDGDICLENNDDDGGGYDWQIVADKLNIDQQTTFQSYATIDENVEVTGLLTDNEIMGINISNSDSENDENDELERTLDMITANQAISSLHTVRQFIESVAGVDISIFEAIGKLEDFVFVNKQPKTQKLITNYFSTVSNK